MTALSRSVLSVVVCTGLATSLGACGDPPFYSSAAFFANMTHAPVSVRLFDQNAKLACEAIEERSGEMLGPQAFSEGARYDVEPGEVLPIEYTPTDDYGYPETPDGSQGDCGASIVQVPGLEPLKVFWSKSFCSSSDSVVDAADEQFRACSVRLEGGGGLLGFAVGKELEGSPERGVEVASEPLRPFGWSGTALKGTVLLEQVEALPDGCLALHQAAGAARETLYLCVPSWAFPFAADSMLSVSTRSVTRTGAATRYLTLSALTGTPPVELELALGASNSPPELPGSVAIVGDGYRTGCGAFALPLGFRPDGASAPIGPGETADFSNGESLVRLLMGRSERIVVAPNDCEPERAELGDRLELLTLTTPLEEP